MEIRPKLDSGLIDQSKYDRLIDLERKYIQTWFSMVKDYFQHNLFMDTSRGDVQDQLNRHILLHGFSSGVDYNLSNFLKVFNTLQYLAWAFRESDLTIPSTVGLENEEILYKWSAYEKLRLINTLTNDIQISIYEKYDDFEGDDFNFIPSQPRFHLPQPENLLENLKSVDNLLTQFVGPRNLK